MSKSFGLALGSGGARGVAHIGVLAALEEAGIKPDYITGCSMGAVVGAYYATGAPAAELKEVALKITKRSLIDVAPGFVRRKALLRSAKMENLLNKYFGDKLIEELEIPFACIATDVYSGSLHIFDKGSVSLAVRASGAIPCVFKPVETDGMLLVDGGCLCRVPVKPLKDMGAEVVLAVDVLSNTEEKVDKVNNILDMLLRVYDIMDAQQTRMHANLLSDGADITLKPKMAEMSQYEIKSLKMAYDEGYEVGKNCIGKLKELLAD